MEAVAHATVFQGGAGDESKPRAAKKFLRDTAGEPAANSAGAPGRLLILLDAQNGCTRGFWIHDHGPELPFRGGFKGWLVVCGCA